MKRNLEPFIRRENYELLEYTPTLFHLFYNQIEHITFQRRIRFVFEYLRGYKVYYLRVKDAIDGYCVVSKGGGRYNFATSDDIVVGPYFVDPNYRGNHYSEILVGELLNCDKYCHLTAYDWIKKSNEPSLKCSQKVGFSVCGEANITGLLRKITTVANGFGEYYILRRRVNCQ